MLFIYPCIQKSFGLRIIVEHCPADATGHGESFKTRYGNFERGSLFFNHRLELRALRQWPCPAFEGFEIIFVIAHTIKLETKSALDLAYDVWCKSVLFCVALVFRNFL